MPDWIQRRRELASIYHQHLSHLPQLLLPPSATTGPHFDVFQNYEIEADKRDALRDYLKEAGVGTIMQWGGIAVHQMRELGFRQKLSYTERVMARSLLLPMYDSLSEVDVYYICDKIKAFYAENRSPR